MLIDKVLEKAKTDPKNYKNLQMVIKIIKQVFNTQEKEGEDAFDGKAKKKAGGQKQQSQILLNALNTVEYRKLIEFFLSDMPALVLQFQDIDLKPFKKFNKKLTEYRESTKEEGERERPHFNLKKVYSKMSTK